jgi:hypothetical protein
VARLTEPLCIWAYLRDMLPEMARIRAKHETITYTPVRTRPQLEMSSVVPQQPIGHVPPMSVMNMSPLQHHTPVVNSY